MVNVEKALREAAQEGAITCQKCGNKIEPDCDECYCGWKNPIMALGFI